MSMTLPIIILIWGQRRKCLPSTMIGIGACSFLPAQTVHKPRLWSMWTGRKCIWTEMSSMCLELSRSRTLNRIKFASVFNHVHLQTAHKAVLFVWKNPNYLILAPIWKICLSVWRETRPYRWDYACKTFDQLSIATNGTYSIVQRKQK